MGELVVYGLDACGMCKRFNKQCDDAGIKYKFVAVGESQGSVEISTKLRAVPWFKGGSIGLPVVDVYGDLQMRPEIEFVKNRREQIKKMKAQFKQLDENKDGTLSFKDVCAFMKELNPTFSDNDLQALFYPADADQNGVLEIDEFLDFVVTGKKATPEIKSAPPLARATSDGIRVEWKQATLDAHNQFRKDHGSPDLVWSDECYLSAKRQADMCQEKRGMTHGTIQGSSGQHGLNIFWCSSPGSTALRCTKAWYDEIIDPGYDLSKPGFKSSIGHFTPVVWKGTTSVGMALSEDGRFIVANYHPPGNYNGSEKFERNVLPRGSPYTPEPEEPPKPLMPALPSVRGDSPSLGAVTATSMSPELEEVFKGCLFPFKEKVVEAFGKGVAMVTVERSVTGATNIMQVTIKQGCSTCRTSGSWGGG